MGLKDRFNGDLLAGADAADEREAATRDGSSYGIAYFKRKLLEEVDLAELVKLGPSQRRGATKFALRRKLLIAMVSILSSMSVALASPSSNLHRRHSGHAGEVGTVGRAQSFEPPRMIEVRPGWWISTYDCVTDEGQGRWRPCSAGGA